MRSVLAVIPLVVAAVAIADDAAKTTEIKVDKLTLTVPADWKQEKPSSNLRLAQFVIPAVEGDKEPSELVVFPPFGGSAEANIQRWIAQFEAEGREVKMTEGASTHGKYVLVDLKGTYKKPEGPPILQKSKPAPGYRMYGVILSAKDGGNYFLKLTGPEKTVAAQSDAIRTAFGAKAADEKEYTIEK